MSEPWFIMYKSRGHRRLVPNSAQAWWLTGAFVAAMTLPGVLIAIFQEVWLLWLMVPWMLIALFVYLRLAAAHSEVVPIDEAVELWRAQKRQGKGRR